MRAGNREQSRALPEPQLRSPVLQSGIALKADVRLLLSSEPLFARFSGQLGDALGRAMPLSLRLCGLEADDSVDQYTKLCVRMAAALDLPGAHTRLLELSVPADALASDLALAIRRKTLGEGRVNILCDSPSIVDDDFWMRLWRLRRETMLTVALWPHLRGQSALLPSELADNVEPVLGLQVPTESAWVSGWIYLPDFLTAAGEIDMARLSESLRELVAALDKTQLAASWPTPAISQDAWLNRRLAVRIEGIGELVVAMRRDPTRNTTLRLLADVLDHIRNELRRVTRSMSRARESLPAISLGNPVRGWPEGPARDTWEKRWRRAVLRSAVCHRNMLALSPWAFFPQKGADLAYQGLLPLLSRADVCGFRPRPSLAHWKFNEFKHFHQSIWAIRRQIEAQTLVAERL